jgi:hypothetical protein
MTSDTFGKGFRSIKTKFIRRWCVPYFVPGLQSTLLFRLTPIRPRQRSPAVTSSTRPSSITFGWSQKGEVTGSPNLLMSSNLCLSARRRRCSRAARKNWTVVVGYGESCLHWVWSKSDTCIDSKGYGSRSPWKSLRCQDLPILSLSTSTSSPPLSVSVQHSFLPSFVELVLF